MLFNLEYDYSAIFGPFDLRWNEVLADRLMPQEKSMRRSLAPDGVVPFFVVVRPVLERFGEKVATTWSAPEPTALLRAVRLRLTESQGWLQVMRWPVGLEGQPVVDTNSMRSAAS